MLSSDKTQQAHKSSSQFSQKVSHGKSAQFRPNLNQNYATLYNDLFVWAQKVGKNDVSQVSKTSSLQGQMGNLKPHWPTFFQPLIS